jgi:hypothetical protein
MLQAFGKRILIILAITFLADRGLGYVVSVLYKKTSTTDEAKINAVTYQMNAPVVFMGSSRCHHHYIPSIIADSLHKPVFNAGLWGMRNIYFQYALLNDILQRYTPETICLEIHPIDYLNIPGSTIETVGTLAPFINYAPATDSLLKKDGIYYKSQLSHLYRYNGEFSNILIGNVSARTNAADAGFKGLYGQIDTVTTPVRTERFDAAKDPDRLYYLQAFINKCREKKIQLIFIYSPMLSVEKTHLFDVPDSVAASNGIPFINNYKFEGITGHAKFYFDYGHLNEEGARKYSSAVATQLKPYIQAR